MSNDLRERAWVEVNLDAVRANYETVRRHVGAERSVLPMVKADAYGLGAARVVRALEPLEPWGYGVATAMEGAALRELGVRRPVHVFTPLTPGAVETAARARLVASVSSVAGLEAWAGAAERHGPLEFHVEVDTGMGRAGFDWRDTSEWAAAVHARTGARLRWTGVFTHFHSADAADAMGVASQWRRFQDALAQLPVPLEDLCVHACNSAASLRWPEYGADAVRPGIFLYGGAAAPGVAGVARPRAVAAVRARLVQVRRVPPGSTVGYGATYQARGWERWGTVAIGYGDGLPRTLANRGSALLRGRRIPVVGRISMDMTVVDMADLEAEPGEIVTFVGREGDAEITVDEVAERAGTISYEILTGLTTRLPRVET